MALGHDARSADGSGFDQALATCPLGLGADAAGLRYEYQRAPSTPDGSEAVVGRYSPFDGLLVTRRPQCDHTRDANATVESA